MRRHELEHLIRAMGAITNEYEFVVVGSQSILGACPNAPAELLMSVEADVYPLKNPGMSDLIDGSIGEGSPFNEHYGYYAHGVGPETAILPAGWQSRLIRVQNENTNLKVGLCLEPHDLAASKLAAGREKDFEFVEEMLRYKLVEPETLIERVGGLPIPPERIQVMKTWVTARIERLASPEGDNRQQAVHAAKPRAFRTARRARGKDDLER